MQSTKITDNNSTRITEIYERWYQYTTSGNLTPYTAKGIYNLSILIDEYLNEESRYEQVSKKELCYTQLAKIREGNCFGLRFDNFTSLSNILPYSDKYLLLLAIERESLVTSYQLASIEPGNLYPILKSLPIKDLLRLHGLVSKRTSEIIQKEKNSFSGINSSTLAKQKEIGDKLFSSQVLGKETPFTFEGLARIGEILFNAQVNSKLAKYKFYLSLGLNYNQYTSIIAGTYERITPKTFCKIQSVTPYTAQDLICIAMGLDGILNNKQIQNIKRIEDIYPLLREYSFVDLLDLHCFLTEVIYPS